MADKGFQNYWRPAEYKGFVSHKDVYVTGRDGTRLCIDIYIPDGEGPFPALLSFGQHNKDLADADYTAANPPQPAWSNFWFGVIEAGDTRFLTSRGYVHVIGQTRGAGKSDDGDPITAQWDAYDIIEWMAEQPWCDGNIGMVGLSNYGMNQLVAAAAQPPHLKAIFPFDPAFCMGFFRELHMGGVISTHFLHVGQNTVDHMMRGKPPKLEGKEAEIWAEAMKNPDFQMYKSIYNVLTQKGENNPLQLFYQILMNPYDEPDMYEKAMEKIRKIKIPVYTGSGQYAIDYEHWPAAQNWYENLEGIPKKFLLTGPAAEERPYHYGLLHTELLRWYDYWLKGIDTGIMDDPNVRYYVTGENKWRSGDNWPLPETQFTPFYLDSWERLRTRPIEPDSWEGTNEPDAFVQSPPTLTSKVSKLRYISDPLSEDLLIAGPIGMHFWASIDSDDTNWIVTLKDLGPDGSNRTARPGERDIPDLPEKFLTRGFLKASMRELDEELSTEWKPWQKLTKEAQKPIVPGEIVKYDVEVMSVCHMFKEGHRICVEISCMDMPDGPCAVCNVEYIPFHVCRNATVCHKIYRDGEHPSHILLPVIPL